VSIDRRRFLIGTGATLALGFVGCGSDAGGGAAADAGRPDAEPTDAGADATRDAVADASPLDAAVDAAPDATAPDATPDATAPDAATGPAAVSQDDALFPTAVLAGAMEPDRALVCGQTTAASARLRVWADTPEAPVVVETDVDATEGFLKAPVEGLSPATRYAFAFFGAERRSPVGRFRTAPAADSTAPLTLGATACTNAINAPYAAMSLAARQPMDAFIHLGDMSYNDGCMDLAAFRRKWRETLQDPGYRDLFAAAGAYITWDDHEIANNDQVYELPPEVVQAGHQSFFEALQVPRRDGDRYWRTYRWGLTAEIFVLDCRSERDPATRGTPQATYLSREQMDWLKQGLSASPCHFKVLMNSVPITAFPDTWSSAAGDRWQGYAAARDELLDHITSNDLRNVWFLTGDFHFGAVCRVEADGPRRRMWEILCGPGASTGNPVAFLVERQPQVRELYLPERQFPHFNVGHAVTTLRFDPAADAVQATFIDGHTGDLLYDVTLRESDP
jgi:alkaline phosphatase D